jgi:toxin-antitoxin system PIN domain toxin
MICLPDVNVWLALAVETHQHHSVAKDWIQESDGDQLLFCRITEMGLLRLLTNARVMGGSPLTTLAAWNVRDQLLRDPFIHMADEPAQFQEHWRRTSRAGKIGPNFWTDAYLVSFCAAANCTLVTLDRALAVKRACPVRLLA